MVSVVERIELFLCTNILLRPSHTEWNFLINYIPIDSVVSSLVCNLVGGLYIVVIDDKQINAQS